MVPMATTIPSYSVASIVRQRDKLLDSLLAYCGTTPAGGEFDDFVSVIAGVLEADRETVLSSVRYLVGSQLDDVVLRDAAWRLAGNLSKLRRGKPVLPWRTQAEPEWVPLHVVGSQPHGFRSGRGFNYQLRVLAGSPCPMLLEKAYPVRYVAALARRMGFGGRRSRYRFQHGSELVNLQFTGLIDPIKCGAAPNFEQVRVSAGQRRWNLGVLAQRQRVNFVCPRKYTHPCFRCWVGYEDCPAGCHLSSFVLRYCSGCRRQSMFDPLRTANRCVACEESAP